MENLACSMVFLALLLMIAVLYFLVIYGEGQLKMSSACRPEIDGHVEVVNHSLQQYLQCMSTQALKQWSRHLPWAAF